jgi:hypothetical protein
VTANPPPSDHDVNIPNLAHRASRRALLVAWALIGGSVGAQTVAPEDARIEFSGSGFVSVVAGKVLGGTHDAATDLGYRCPCFIADYAQNGVYESGGWRFGPDSKLGLQGTASIDRGRYALTGQLVSRGADQGGVDLEWGYATAELNSEWTLQVGRKRLPLFVSSEVQDVGYALPWVHLPPQLYGWEIVNYNGVNLTWRRTVGDWLATVNLLGGSETSHDSGYWRIYKGKDSHTDARWKQIAGSEAKFTRDWFDLRLVYITSLTQNRAVSAGETDYSAPARQHIYGLSLNADDGRWVARAEFLYINRKADYGTDHAQLYAVGYRFGKWLPLLSYANYQQTVVADPSIAEGHSNWSSVLRYEWSRSSALKVQLDWWHDKVAPNFASMHGDARLLSVAYERVF